MQRARPPGTKQRQAKPPWASGASFPGALCDYDTAASQRGSGILQMKYRRLFGYRLVKENRSEKKGVVFDVKSRWFPKELSTSGKCRKMQESFWRNFQRKKYEDKEAPEKALQPGP
ncbi:hypothetical protein EYF80_012437 [Liparis tanakae]|uniref:Uncharacterized protein n=1 Tax=Liparis tanakae TaxID=230148 RepID=A0A4Z2IJH5_9TELE|nr:hypothetical protein EYF80_012437 [Liparis tanakae]